MPLALRGKGISEDGEGPKELVAACAERLLKTSRAKAKAKGKTQGELVALLANHPSVRYKSMSDIPEMCFYRRKQSMPVGHAALTTVYVGGHPVQALLDSGASVCAISEELFL